MPEGVLCRQVVRAQTDVHLGNGGHSDVLVGGVEISRKEANPLRQVPLDHKLHRRQDLAVVEHAAAHALGLPGECGDHHGLVRLLQRGIQARHLRSAVLAAAHRDRLAAPAPQELDAGEGVEHRVEGRVADRSGLHVHRPRPHGPAQPDVRVDGASGDPGGDVLSAGDHDEALDRHRRRDARHGHRGQTGGHAFPAPPRELVGHVPIKAQRMREARRPPTEPVLNAQDLPHLFQVVHLVNAPGKRTAGVVRILGQEQSRLQWLQRRRAVCHRK